MSDKRLISQEIKAEGGSTISDVTQIIAEKYYSRSQAEELNDYLARAVAAYEARMYQLVARPAVPPDEPYRFLYAFEIEDADIFFGRGAASEGLYQTVLKDRLIVLHAKSGAGKTSLLNAGLSPHLIREGRLPVYARAYEDPLLAIKRAIAPPSLGPWPYLLPKLTLHEFLGLACAHLGRKTQELAIILDQFEGFFIFWPERDHRQPFIEALGDWYDDKTLPVRFVIALRKDYYSDLADFRGRIPTILYNEYRLDTMTREEAQAAVTGPVAKLGHPVAYEPALLDMLLDDLARGGMELPHLQIICTRLHESLAEGETTITLDSYEELGRAEGVLGGYLHDVLDRLPGRGRAIAKQVLKELVSSGATKRVLSYDNLAARVEAEEDELDDVLARLVDDRLLLRGEIAGEIMYEMAHEYLIEEIKTWVDQSDLEFKQAEELLAGEVANWRVLGTLIPRDRLELLHMQRERFKGLDSETWECILQSALQADFAVAGWAKLAGGAGEKLLLAALDDPHEKTRRAATHGLGAIWELPEVSRLGDKNSSVRRAAARALGKARSPRTVDPLIAILRDEDGDVRWAAADALGQLGDPRAVEPLIATLRDKYRRIRRTAAEALRNIGEPAVDPLMEALRDGHSDVRELAVEILGNIGNPRVVDSLIAALRDESGKVRLAAAEALGTIRDQRAVEPLIAALRDESGKLRLAAAEALGRIRDQRAIEPLIAALRDESGKLRLAAAEALGRIRDQRAVEPLIAALRDEDSGVRWAAGKALGELAEPSVKPLIATLEDNDSAMRRAAARVLGEIHDPCAVEPLIAALEDTDCDVRWEAARALGERHDPRAVEPLIVALKDERSAVRRQAAKALGYLGDPRAVMPLTAALTDEDSRVRRRTAEALVTIGEPAVKLLIAALREESTVRWKVVRVLKDIGEPTVELLIPVLRDKDPDVRRAAAVTLGGIGSTRAVEPLIAALRDLDINVRLAAVGGLREIGDPRAMAPLTAALRDVDIEVRRSAARPLKRIGTPEVRAALD